MEEMEGGYQMSVSKTILLALLMICSCANHQSEVQPGKSDTLRGDTALIKQERKDSPRMEATFLPDTMVNGVLKLEDQRSSESFYPGVDKARLVERLRESPVMVFCSADRLQYLLAYQYEGNTKNAFSCFEIGYSGEVPPDECNSIKQPSFSTGTGLRLGMPFDSLVAIKGSGYEIRKNQDTIVTYRMNNYESSDFLKRYNMPGYFLECSIRNAKVQKIKFGFDYP